MLDGWFCLSSCVPPAGGEWTIVRRLCGPCRLASTYLYARECDVFLATQILYTDANMVHLCGTCRWLEFFIFVEIMLSILLQNFLNPTPAFHDCLISTLQLRSYYTVFWHCWIKHSLSVNCKLQACIQLYSPTSCCGNSNTVMNNKWLDVRWSCVIYEVCLTRFKRLQAYIMVSSGRPTTAL